MFSWLLLRLGRVLGFFSSVGCWTTAVFEFCGGIVRAASTAETLDAGGGLAEPVAA